MTRAAAAATAVVAGVVGYLLGDAWLFAPRAAAPAARAPAAGIATEPRAGVAARESVPLAARLRALAGRPAVAAPRATAQEAELLADPVAFIDLRNRLVLQVEDQYPRLRACARVSTRTRCVLRAEVEVSGALVETRRIARLACRSDAEAEERARVDACFDAVEAGLEAVAAAGLAAHLASYVGEVDLPFDWDERAPVE